MYLHSLRLQNVRGFRDLDFKFERTGKGTPAERYAGWTVITGDNGSGKSTLLKAIALALTGKEVARALQPSFHRWAREGRGVEEASIEIEVLGVGEDDRFAEGGRTVGGVFPAKVAIENGAREATLVQVTPPSKKAASYRAPERSIWSDASLGWFSCSYGPFRRVFGYSPEAAREMAAPIRERYVTMFEEAASLAEVDIWLKSLKHRELEHRNDAAQQLKLVLGILAADLLPSGVRVDRVDSGGLWLRDAKGIELSWREMSDGYRSALALLADILRHLIKTYGIDGLWVEDDDGVPRIMRSGVVLIDEIDAHLHPAWQREIGFWLKKRFPRLQFIVTTHSPIILQAADPNGLFRLVEPGSDQRPFAVSKDDYDRIIAAKSDTILLSSAFGLDNTRSPVAVEGRRVLSRLRAKRRAGGRLTDAEAAEMRQLDVFDTSDEED